MSIDLQINPTAPALRISREAFAKLLNIATPFEMFYGSIGTNDDHDDGEGDGGPTLEDVLAQLEPHAADEGVAELVDTLKRDGYAEILIGH